ncbi:MAG: zf-HC2 domain-containing protein [Myxococcaceae bacterium]|nr:zf-HC2 domain-containing protein [Myxococcaceae bacterium]
MRACPEYEELLTLHAAEALELGEAARVRAHLESCAGCRSEAESSARMLAGVALPSPSAAVRERMDALPQRVLGQWRREQVRKAFRARTLGALLAAAAVLLVVLSPSLRRSGAPQPVPPSAAAAEPSESQAEFEQWASANPLGELLEPTLAEEDAEAWEAEEEAELELPESELF